MNQVSGFGLEVVLAGLALMVGGGAVAAGLSRTPRAAGVVAGSSAVLGALVAMVPAAQVLAGAQLRTLELAWSLPGGVLSVGLDPLSAFFLLPTLLLGAAAAVYGAQYLQASKGTRQLGPAFFGFNLLVASIAMVTLARNAVLFLVAWETMAVATALLVSWEHERKEARRAGWVYFVAAHLGAALLFLVFLLLKQSAGSFDFAAFARRPPSGGAAVAVLLLALLGFSSKTGFVPFHVWLPEAHAAAPSHVSAMMSGVLVKVGLYGLLRVVLLLGSVPGWWGPLLMTVGLGSALVAIALALYQRDLKRALAYSSVENVGLITLGLGAAWWAASRGMPRVAAVALAGGLLHLWNHVLMKGGMFMVAGSVLHGGGSRDLEALGGLARRMPATTVAMAALALALSALPPFNGFVSEWLVYVGLMRFGTEGGGSLAAMLAVGGMALVGSLAALTFVRLFGIAMLGQPRSQRAAEAHESSWWMLGPLFLLVAASALVALAPALVLGAQGAVRVQLLGAVDAALPPGDQASLSALSWVGLALWAALAAAGAGYALVLRRRPAAADATWGCGYAAPTGRMQYGGRAFAELASGHALPQGLQPRVARVRPTGLFPKASSLSVDDADPMTRGVYEPAFTRVAGRFAAMVWVQRGLLHSYLAYVLVALVAALAWVTLGAQVAP